MAVNGIRSTIEVQPRRSKLVQNNSNSFPRDVSHYTRNIQEDIEHLPPDLSVPKLYWAFQQTYPDNTKIKFKYYKKVFANNFPNLKFRQPRMDTCETCDRLKILNARPSEAGKKAEAVLDAHLKEAYRVY